MKKLTLFLLVFVFTFNFVKAQQASWSFDVSHSKISFSVTHLVISEVTGHFSSFTGKVVSKSEDFVNSEIYFEIDAKSINTDNETRDNHLRSADFFEVEKYPKIIFKSKSFTKVKGNKYKLVGDFTMKDVTKTITLDVVYGGTIKDPWGNTKAGFKISGEVNRFDYNLKWNNLIETGGAVVGKTVKINCFVELTKEK
ncbi:MAG TPA: YceI family protein [Ignavibacteria bacterium]